MKTSKLFYLPLLVLSALLIFACDNGSNSSDASAEELAVLSEMNYARTKPKEYVTERLEPLKSSYTGSKLSSLNELISEMNSMSTLPAYEWGDGLYKAAKEWVETQGPTGEFSHDTNWSGRIKKYCNCGAVAENLSAGYNKAVDIVIQLLVDDGVASRGHRKNILSSSYTHAGAAIGSHKTYKYMCCIDFAGGYSEK